MARAFAIVLVLLRHGQVFADKQLVTTEPLMGTVFLNGWIGVDLFFVLSGYFISAHLFNRGIGSPRFDIKEYFTGRALRIVPAYFAVLFMIAAGLFPYNHVESEGLFTRLFIHVLFLQDYAGSNLNLPFWSLGVEAKFYLLAPLLAWLCLSCRRIRNCILLLIIIAVLAALYRVGSFVSMGASVDYPSYLVYLRQPFHYCIEPFAMGAIIALVQKRNFLVASRQAGFFLIFCSVILITPVLTTVPMFRVISYWDVAVQPALLSVAFGFLVAGCVSLRQEKLPFEWIFRIMARLSYCLYLVHWPLIAWCMKLAGPNNFLAFWAIYISLSAGAALLLHYVVEKPFLLYKSRKGKGGAVAGSNRQPMAAPAS